MCLRQEMQNVRGHGTVALMRGFSIYGHTEKVGAVVAPRPETPCHVESGTVVPRDVARPCGENIRRLSRRVPRPKQSRHRGRCHACSRSWPQTGMIRCAPGLGAGRNTDVEKRLVCESGVRGRS